MPSPKILLIGTTGQLGRTLHQCLQAWQQQPSGQWIDLVAVNRQQLDMAQPQKIREVIRSTQPTLIINAAAYTAVDQAESELELAHRINADAPAVMAEEARRQGAALIHYSTDYVFDGKQSTPYIETDTPNPVNTYGRSKLAGEQAIQAAGIPYLILRTGWLYSRYGHNFLRTILRLAQQQSDLHIVADQHGSPTWSATVANATMHLIKRSWGSVNMSNAELEHWWQDHGGLYHCAAQGQTSWHGFAQHIVAQTPCPHSIQRPVVHSVTTAELARPAQRPAYSVMACNKFAQVFYPLPSWQESLQKCLGRDS